MSEHVPAAMRRAVAERATNRCEYCLLHEADTLFAHEPDHIVAVRHRGPTSLDNLAWACFRCNRLKGSDIASVDIETGRIVRLFHPRQDRWIDHFRLDDGRIVPLTEIGRVTEYLLQLNLPRNVEYRRSLAETGRLPTGSSPP